MPRLFQQPLRRGRQGYVSLLDDFAQHQGLSFRSFDGTTIQIASRDQEDAGGRRTPPPRKWQSPVRKEQDQAQE